MKVAVIGYGYWGPKLVRALARQPGSPLAWVADRDRDALERVRSEFPWLRTTTDVEEVLRSDVDAVAIATPIRTHYALARRALLAGKHVMVEKPLTASSVEASDLALLADERRATLMVGHTFEYNPAIRTLREIVASGEIGAVRRIDTARLNLGLCQPDLNVLWDLAPHDISICSYVLGTEPAAVSARGSATVTPGVEDVAYVELRYPGDVLAHLHLSWLDPHRVRRVTVVGTKKMVVCDDTESTEKVRVFDRGVDFEILNGVEQVGRSPRLTYRDAGAVVRPTADDEPLSVQCAHFLESARAGTRPQSDGHAGARVVRIIEQAQYSLRDGGRRMSLMPDPLDVAPFGSWRRAARPTVQPPTAVAVPEPMAVWAASGD